MCTKCTAISKRKVERPSYETLKKDLENMSCIKVSKKYGVNDTTIMRWFQLYEQKNQTENNQKRCQCGTEISETSLMCKKCTDIKKRKVERPSHETLKKELTEISCKKVAKKYNVCDSTIRQWIKLYEKEQKFI